MIAAFCCVVLGVLAPAAIAQDDEAPEETPTESETEEAEEEKPREANLQLRLKGVKGGKVTAGRRVTGIAKIRPFVAGQKMRIGIYRRGKAVKKTKKTIRRRKGTNAGIVKLRSKRFVKPGKYRFRASHPQTPEQRGASASSQRFAITYPKLGGKSRGNAVKLFHKLLAKRGYRNAPSGRKFTSATSRAVHAFRKTNRMAPKGKATAGIFRKLAKGGGGFNLRHPGAGRHVEVDLSRQVMVLADKGKPQFTYHISSGAPGTPSDRGRFRFYRREPGFNSIGMYYSVYYNRGEATHGYHSVPNHPASHGCIRNPIPDARFIYNWIRLGDYIWVY